jgi:hypothetical protein
MYTVAGKGAVSKARGPGTTAVCLLRGCGKHFRSKKSRPRKYCSPAHAAAAHCQVRPWNKLQERCVGFMAEHQLSFNDLTRRATLPKNSLHRWFVKKGSTLTKERLGKLAATLGISEELARQEAGGETADARWADNGKAVGNYRTELLRSKPQSKKAKRLRAASRRGGRAPKKRADSDEPRTWSKARQMKGSSGIRQAARSPEGRARRSFSMSLSRWHQNNGDDIAPSIQDIRQMAERAALTNGACIGRVIVYWNPFLAKLGLPRLGGRPGEAERCFTLRTWIAEHGAPGTYGYWAESPEKGEEWRRSHSRGCPTLRKALKDGVETPCLRGFETVPVKGDLSP